MGITKKVVIYRSSVTGKIVTRKFAEANPETTEKETRVTTPMSPKKDKPSK